MATDLKRIQRGLYEVLQSRLTPFYPNGIDVSWSYQSIPAGSLPGDIVSLKWLGGPTPVHRTPFAKGVPFLPPTQIRVTVDSVVEGFRYYLVLNHNLYVYDAQAGDTVDTIRDQLIALLMDQDSDVWTAVAFAPGVLTITPNYFGAIFQGSISENLSHVTSFAESFAVLNEQTRQCIIGLSCYSKGKKLGNGAQKIQDRVHDILTSITAVYELWQTWGISIQDLGITNDVTDLSGPTWESRVTQEIIINARSWAVEPTDTIDSFALQTSFQTFGQGTEYTSDLLAS